MKPTKTPSPRSCRHDSKLLKGDSAETRELTKTPKPIVLTPQDLAVISGCNEPGTQEAVQLVLDAIGPILGHGMREIDGSQQWLLQAVKTVFASERPATGLQALLVSQALSCHAMALHFGKRSLTMPDPEVADRYAARSQRLMALFAQQLETLSRLKGSPGQKIVVEHLNVEAGGRAVVAGLINAKSGDGEGV